jgi:hypothetical protein
MNDLRATLEPIWQSFSGDAAWQAVADLSRFHRIQASPGHRQAAQWLHRQLVRNGLAAEILSYPADERTQFWAWPAFQEWECTAATLQFVAPEGKAHGVPDPLDGLLADFRACPISVIQRSAPFDGELEVVLLEDGLEEADYEGRDVAGKLVLSRGPVRRVWELAVAGRGAAGILFDGMRPVPPVRLDGDLADVRQYTSFWWQPGDARCFGFVLTPRQGRALRNLLKTAGEPVRVRAHVDSHSYDGAIEVVSAAIPGESDQEVVVVAHLCHPQPSANDNASGAAAVLEAACTLQQLVATGRLARPRRTIRFLWLPEMTGTFAYLSGREQSLDRLIAGINLDMVGEDQDQTGSSWLIERPPEAAASFVSDLLACLRDELPGLRGMDGIAASHTGAGSHLLYRQAEVGFSGGSDHYILSDPSVGVPTPMLNQWPDRYYHTSADTPDRTDPRSLARAGTLAAAYAYWLAAAGPAEATWLGYQMVARFKLRIVAAAQAAVTHAMGLHNGEALARAAGDLDRRLAYLLDRQKAALRSLARLGPVDCLLVELLKEAGRAVERELKWARGALELHAAAANLALAELPPRELGAEERQAAGLVPRRLVRGPIPLDSHLRRLDGGAREAWRQLLNARDGEAHEALTTLALYWANGTRSVFDIAGLVELETGRRDLELLLSYFRLLEQLGFIAKESS